jgi:hypothetical protein
MPFLVKCMFHGISEYEGALDKSSSLALSVQLSIWQHPKYYAPFTLDYTIYSILWSHLWPNF